MSSECINNAILDVYKSNGISFFPFDCFELLNHYKLKLYAYNSINEEFEEYCHKFSDDAYSFKNKIFYNSKKPNKRIRFSLMHELGHFLLMHGENRTPKEEAEANCFASNLLIPRLAIYYTRLHNIKELSNVFGVSLECMEYAYLDYIKWTYRIKHYGMSEYDRHLYSHFYNNEYQGFVYNTSNCIYCMKQIYNKKIPICKECDTPLSPSSIVTSYEIARPSFIH